MEIVIEGRPSPRLRSSFRELWAFRWTTLAFAERDIRVKYKQAGLGVAWAALQPLIFVGIFSIAFGRLAKVPSGGGVSYPAFNLSAVVPWTFLQTGLTFGGNALISDSSLVRKVYFPREIPVIGSVIAASLDFVVGLLVFVALGPVLGARFSLSWLLAPVLGVLIGALAAGASLALGALNVYYRDFRFVLPILLQVWLFASPVAYPITVVPAEWRLAYSFFNPAAGVLDAFRRCLAIGGLPDLRLLGASVTGIAIVCAVGYALFKRLEPNFADVI